nr:MAG TPA: hypothetical protein [Caudoviricetes sp.]
MPGTHFAFRAFAICLTLSEAPARRFPYRR